MTIVRFFSTDSASLRSSKLIFCVALILVISLSGSILAGAASVETYYIDLEFDEGDFYFLLEGADYMEETFLFNDSIVNSHPYSSQLYGYGTVYGIDILEACAAAGFDFPYDDLTSSQVITTSVIIHFDGLLFDPVLYENQVCLYFVLYCSNSLEIDSDYQIDVVDLSFGGDYVSDLDGYDLTSLYTVQSTGLTVYRLLIDGSMFDPDDCYLSIPVSFLSSAVWDTSFCFGMLSGSYIKVIDNSVQTLPPVATETAASPSDTEPDFSGTIGNQNQSLIDAQSDANDLLNEIQVDSPDILDIIDNVEGSLDDISALQSIIYPRSSQFYTFVYSLCAIVVSIALLGYILHGNKTG